MTEIIAYIINACMGKEGEHYSGMNVGSSLAGLISLAESQRWPAYQGPRSNALYDTIFHILGRPDVLPG